MKENSKLFKTCIGRIALVLLFICLLMSRDFCYASSFSANPNDEYFGLQKTSFDLVGVREVWKKGMYGKYKKKAPIVAVIDTGVTKHPDIKNILKGQGIINGKTSSRYSDIDYQGTSIAGIIAAKNNNKIGISGLMPDAIIYPIKIFSVGDYGEITSNQGCLATAINMAVSKGVDVINLSLESPIKNKRVENAIKFANEKNIIVVASCGGSGSTAKKYPAAYSKVVSVSAITDDLQKEEYSNHNSTVDVAAPGTNIPCTVPTGSIGESLLNIGYSLNSGTAYSTAYVSALAAMYKAIKPNGNYDGFMKMIKNTSYDLGASGRDNTYGYGLIDFANSYSYLVGPKNCKHNYGKWKTLVKKNGTSNGLKKRTCKKCLFTQNMCVMN